MSAPSTQAPVGRIDRVPSTSSHKWRVVVLLCCCAVAACSAMRGDANLSASAAPVIAGAASLLSVYAASSRVDAGGSLWFQAQNGNRPTDQVIWMVNGIQGGNAEVGQISASGVYRAPAHVAGALPVTIQAALKDSPLVTSTAPLTVFGI
ncbi:hypothetical protein JCM19000A_41120 [Silvimonas sp. JCM 19000]